MIAWLRRWWAWIAGGLVALGIALKAYAAGKRQAWNEAAVERAAVRKARAVRYSNRRKAKVDQAEAEHQRRSKISQPNRSDWDELRRANAELDKEDRTP